jgi:hypothetical protein
MSIKECGAPNTGHESETRVIRDSARATSQVPTACAATALSSAARRWLRRGYRVEYEDGYLIQLARKQRVARPRLLLTLGGACMLGVGGLFALSAYLWHARHPRRHVVSLALSPQQRVITHVQWER